MDIEVRCDCGNPDCHANVQLRKGYVHIRHPDGREEERWDHFYIDAFDWDENDPDKKTKMVELMLPPREARRIMWFLIREYMPVANHAVKWWRHYPAYWWWSIQNRLWEWWNSPAQSPRNDRRDNSS